MVNPDVEEVDYGHEEDEEMAAEEPQPPQPLQQPKLR